MTVTAIILAHYIEREKNLRIIVDDLLNGSVKPNEIIIIRDDPNILFTDNDTTSVRISRSFLPNIRFAIGSQVNTDYCLFIDDDLSVNKDTLRNFVDYAKKYPDSVLGLQGSILGHTDNPYADDESISRGNSLREVDIIIRTYFAPTKLLAAGLYLSSIYNHLPKKSLDDVYLCLGNKYLNENKNYVIPVDKNSDVRELGEYGVGQSIGNGEHYENRNRVTKFLMDIYE